MLAVVAHLKIIFPYHGAEPGDFRHVSFLSKSSTLQLPRLVASPRPAVLRRGARLSPCPASWLSSWALPSSKAPPSWRPWRRCRRRGPSGPSSEAGAAAMSRCSELRFLRKNLGRWFWNWVRLLSSFVHVFFWTTIHGHWTVVVTINQEGCPICRQTQF